MPPIQIDRSHDSRLRFVFDDAVHSFGLAANATFGDIALALRDVASTHRGIPVAIDVTFAQMSFASPPVVSPRGPLAN